MKKSILLALGLSFSAPTALAGGSLGGSGLGLQGGSMGGGGLGLQGGISGGAGVGGIEGGSLGGGSGVMQRSVPDDEINSLNVDGGFSGGGPPSIVEFISSFFPGTSIHQGD